MYAGGVSRLCRPYLSDRFFFITVRLLERRRKLDDADFESLALAIRRARAEHSFFLTAWVFLPNHWHVILAPQYPLTISEVMNSIKNSSTTLVNEGAARRGRCGRSDILIGTMRSVKEYNEKVEYIHLNPVKAGLAVRPQDWRWSSVNEYSGMSAADQMRHCGLTIDRVSLPSNPKTRI